MLTSQREGFPNVFLEAMMCGIPSIFPNCGDIIDIARHEFNCLVVQKHDDCRAFAQAIIHLPNDKELYDNLSQNACRTVRKLSIEEVARKRGHILGSMADQGCRGKFIQ